MAKKKNKKKKQNSQAVAAVRPDQDSQETAGAGVPAAEAAPAAPEEDRAADAGEGLQILYQPNDLPARENRAPEEKEAGDRTGSGTPQGGLELLYEKTDEDDKAAAPVTPGPKEHTEGGGKLEFFWDNSDAHREEEPEEKGPEEKEPKENEPLPEAKERAEVPAGETQIPAKTAAPASAAEPEEPAPAPLQEDAHSADALPGAEEEAPAPVSVRTDAEDAEKEQQPSAPVTVPEEAPADSAAATSEAPAAESEASGSAAPAEADGNHTEQKNTDQNPAESAAAPGEEKEAAQNPPASGTELTEESAAAARRRGRERRKSGSRRRSAPSEIAEGIELEDAEAEEKKAEEEAEKNGWLSPEEAARRDEKTKDARKGSGWRHLKRGVRIAVIVVVCIIAAGVGFFHYEYTRLQKDQSEAYTDNYVEQLKEEDEKSDVVKKSEADMEKNLADVESADVVAAEGEIFEDSNVYNLLLIGTDDRTEKFSTDARGDTCILLSINRDTGVVTLASFERGIGVPILWGPYEGQWDWLTHAFRYGGAQMMVEEIRDNFLVDVDRYIRINIRTLVKLVDAIGGVDVELTQAEADHLNHPEGTFTEGYAKGIGMEDEEQFDLVAGVNHLNGTTAMVYARTRYIDDDWHRVQRQRKVIMAAAEKLSKLSATQMISTLDAVVPLVQTDLSETEVAELLTLAPTFMGAEIQQLTIPADGTYGSMRGMDDKAMYAVDFNANAKLLREILYGVTTEEAESEVEEEGGTAATNYTNTSRDSGYVADSDVNAAAVLASTDSDEETESQASSSGTYTSGSYETGDTGTASYGTGDASTGNTTSAYGYTYNSAAQSSYRNDVEQAMNVPDTSTETVTDNTQAESAAVSDSTQETVQEQTPVETAPVYSSESTGSTGTQTTGAQATWQSQSTGTVTQPAQTQTQTQTDTQSGTEASTAATVSAAEQQAAAQAQADTLNAAATQSQAAATAAAVQAQDETLSDEVRAAAQAQAEALAVQAQQQAVAAQQAQQQADAAAAQAAAEAGAGTDATATGMGY